MNIIDIFKNEAVLKLILAQIVSNGEFEAMVKQEILVIVSKELDKLFALLREQV
jgi:hypothetical protein